MTWLELAENPEAVKSLFETVPSLIDVEIVRIVVERDGPTVEIHAALDEAPTKPSRRSHESGANAVTLKLQLLGVTGFSLEGWATENRAAIDIRLGDSNRIDLTVSGISTRLNCTSKWLRIIGLTPYRRENVRKNAKTEDKSGTRQRPNR
jgi:hypothetical protein